MRDGAAGSWRDRFSRQLMRLVRRLSTEAGWASLRADLGAPSMAGGLLELRRKGVQPARILDGGACKGEWAALARRLFPQAQILMVEPQPRHAQHLQGLCAAQAGLQFAPVLLGPISGVQVDFTVLDDAGGGTGSSVLPENSDVPRHVLPLHTTTLDALVQAQGFGPPDLIKLDVQGYELEVLKGAGGCLEAGPVLLLELSVWPYNQGSPLLADMLAWLAQRGFRSYDVLDLSYRAMDHTLVQLDMLFLREDHPLLGQTTTRFAASRPAA
jgi:FkbM family methyltransferase